MTVDKCRKILGLYRANLTNFCRGVVGYDIDTEEIVPCQFPEDENVAAGAIEGTEEKIREQELRVLQHLNFMLGRMEKFLDENRTEKFFRWLGFVQGTCWTLGFQTLKELKDLNRPEPDDGEATVGDPSTAEIAI